MYTAWENLRHVKYCTSDIPLTFTNYSAMSLKTYFIKYGSLHNRY